MTHMAVLTHIKASILTLLMMVHNVMVVPSVSGQIILQTVGANLDMLYSRSILSSNVETVTGGRADYFNDTMHSTCGRICKK